MGPSNSNQNSAPEPAFIPSGELAGFEAARFLAAVFVVWIHASIDVELDMNPDAGFIGRFAVPFFVLSSVFFACLSTWGRPWQTFSSYFTTRFERIYVPFIAWSCVYVLLKALQGRTPTWSLAMLWDGGSYQLWYLPYIFVLCLGIFPAQRLVLRMPQHAKKTASLFAMLGLAIALLPVDRLGDLNVLNSNTPYLWLEALPSLFFGFALACLYGFGDRSIWTWPPLVWLGIGLALACVLASSVFEELASALYNAAGLSVGVAALGVSLAPPSWLSVWVKKLSPLGKLSFGIYLVHILFIGPLRSVAASQGLNTTLAFALLATLVAGLCSMFLTMGFLRLRWLRWTVR